MKSIEYHDTPPVLTDEDLLSIQLRIAQRADQLAEARGKRDAPFGDTACWLQAEREILGCDAGTPARALR